MSNKAKAAGTDAENKVRDYAKSRGWKYAELLRQGGALDKGDVRLGDGVDFVIEVKGGQGALSAPHQHLREMQQEVLNAKARYGAVIAKKPGSAKVGQDWVAMMPVDMLFDIIDALYEGWLV